MNAAMFTNKTYIITGAGQGIGFTIAEQLALRGAHIFLNDLDAGLAENAARTIRDAGGHCTAIPGDAGDMAIIQQLVDTAVQKTGRLDGAVANAGITTFGDFFLTRRKPCRNYCNSIWREHFFLPRPRQSKCASSRKEVPFC